MLQRMFIGTGIGAIAVMVALAVVVLDGRGGSAPGVEVAAAGGSVTEIGELPDPQARGVVILDSRGQLYSYTADGEAAGGPFLPPYESGLSPDGKWYAYRHCPDADTCMLVILPSSGTLNVESIEEMAVALPADFVSGEWSRSGAELAALDEGGALHLVDPETREAREVQGCCVTAYAWTADDELLLAGQGKSRESWIAVAGDGPAPARISTQGAPVTRFYESPDATQFAFAQDREDGLSLVTLDMPSGQVTDYGALHEAHEPSGTPFAIAWSPDQRYIAIGPVQTPYKLFVLDTQTASVAAAHTFEEGYAGELVWSPADNLLAVSTYSPDRLRHEVYVVDPTSDGSPRHLVAGCRIVWSPDGRFLAAKAEPHTVGAVAVNVETGDSWRLAGNAGFTPVAWAADEATALEQVRVPGRSAAVLGK